MGYSANTVYPKKYAHGFVVLCLGVVMQSFIMNSHEVFIHIHQGCFAGTGAIVRLPQCQWSKRDGYGKISQCITTTKHSKAKTVCIFLGIYCTYMGSEVSLFPVSNKMEWCINEIVTTLTINNDVHMFTNWLLSTLQRRPVIYGTSKYSLSKFVKHETVTSLGLKSNALIW